MTRFQELREATDTIRRLRDHYIAVHAGQRCQPHLRHSLCQVAHDLLDAYDKLANAIDLLAVKDMPD